MADTAIATVEGGTIWLLRSLEIGDEVDLDRARAKLDEARGARRGAATLRGPEKGPGGVQLATQPLDLYMGMTDIDGVAARTTVRLFDFGVASVRFAIPIRPGTNCPELVAIAAKIEKMTAVDDAARALWERLAAEIGDSIRAPSRLDIMEDYTLFEVLRVRGHARAKDAMKALDPATLLLAEPDRAIEPGVARGWRVRAIHYYAEDAAVIGWNAALVIDPEGGRDVLEVLEIANARLLELRYYDAVLGRELARVYDAATAARRGTSLFRSPFVHVARRAATLYIEMTDLYDRLQGAVTLRGDAYTARLYREASARFRLDEIGGAVEKKLGALATVTEILESEIGHRRTTLLEVAVVLLIVLEVVVGLIRH